MDREDQRIKVTKKAIRKALFELLKSKDIQQITIKELCQKAAINRGTFYNHYTSCLEVLKEIEQDAMKDLLVDLNQVSYDPMSKPFLNRFLEKIKSEKEFYKILFSQERDILFFKGLEQNVKEKLAIQDNYLFLFIINGSISLIREWMKNNCDISVETFADILYQFNQKLLPENSRP